MLVEGCWLLRVGQGKSLGPYPAGIGSLVIMFAKRSHSAPGLNVR